MAYREIILADRPSNYWRLNEPSGTSAVDLVAGANGTISGGVTLAQPGALADGDKAMLFNGTTGYVDLGNVAALAFTTAFSVEVWCKCITGNGYLITKADSGSGQGWAVQVVAGSIVFYTYSTSGALYHFNTSPAVYNDGAWHHVVTSWDGTTSANSARIYVDGVLVKSITPAVGVPAVNTRRCLIGATDLVGNQGSYFPGSLDEVAIYPSALTAAQILAHYQARALPFLPGTYPYAVVQDGASNFWRLNEPSGTTAVDLVGGANGTISGGVTLNQPGALSDGDKAMTFDGATGKIVTAAVPWVLGTTVEAWIKATTVPDYSAVLSNRFTNAANSFTQNLFCVINHRAALFANYGTPQQSVGAITVDNGQWHHLVWVITGTTLTVYVDGAVAITTAFTPHPTLTANPVGIGYDPQQATDFWPGSLDDVAIYPVALTPAQIAAHYTARLWAPTLAAPLVEDDEDDDEAALRLREFYGSVSGSARVLATDNGVLPLVPASAKQSVFLQEIHVEVTALGAGAAWTVQDGAGVPLVPAIPATALAHQDFYFGANGVPCSEATALALAVTGGAAGSVTWEGYRRLTGPLTLAPFLPRYADLVLADGASNYWRLNETSGLTAVDGIGGKTGTISGGVTLNQPGALAEGSPAMAFDGTSGKIVTAANVTIPLVCTLEAWVNGTFGSLRPILHRANNAPMFYVNGTVLTLYDGDGPVSAAGAVVVTSNVWHHVVVVLNGATAIFYVDGVLDRSQALVRTTINLKPAEIGWSVDNAAFFSGSIDEVAIYPVALTPAQIAAHYAVGMGRAVPV